MRFPVSVWEFSRHVNTMQCDDETPMDDHVIINSIPHYLIGNSPLASTATAAEKTMRHQATTWFS